MCTRHTGEDIVVVLSSRFIFYIFGGPKELEVSREGGGWGGRTEKTFRYRQEYIPSAFQTAMNFISRPRCWIAKNK